QPSARNLVVPNNGVPVVACVAHSSETGPNGFRGYGSVQHRPGLVVLFALLGINGDSGVYDLHDVVRPNRQTAIRRTTEIGGSLRPRETRAEPVETLLHWNHRLGALRRLLNCDACCTQSGWRWRRNGLVGLLPLLFVRFIGVFRTVGGFC